MMHLEDQLCFKFYALSRQMTGLYRPLLEELDLTYPQYLVLLVLWNTKSINVKALGGCLLLDSGTLTPLLKRLEKKKLLTRRRDPADERSVLIELSETGIGLQERARCLPEELNKTLQMDEEMYLNLKSLLDHLLMQFDENKPRIAN